MKHSEHSRQRVKERVGSGFKLIRHKLAKGEYIGLPRQTLNKRVSLVKVSEDQATIVIWSKHAHKIITVLTPNQYIRKFGNNIPENIREELLKYCSKRAEKENLNYDEKNDNFISNDYCSNNNS